MLNLATILEETALRRPDKAAFILGPHRLSFSELDSASSRVATALADRGIGAGDKVALSCPNLPYFPVVYYGILKAGAAVVPLNVLLKRREIAYHLEDSDAKAFFCFEGTAELAMGEEGAAGFAAVPGCEHLVLITADPAAPTPDFGVPDLGAEDVSTLSAFMADGRAETDAALTHADNTAVILYTSGTTGQPKGAELTHSNLFLNTRCTADMLRATADDVGIIVLPLFHSFGQVVQMNANVLSGATSVLLPRFEPGAALAAMQEHGVTIFCGVPTMYWALLHHPPDEAVDLARIAGKLRLCASGGASLPLEVLRGFEEKFEVPILEGYGLSETSPVASFNQLDRDRKPGSVGTPIWGVRMRIALENGDTAPVGEPGEILIRGHNLMKGYYKRPEATAETLRGGWLHTGDVGTMDEDGFFYIVDRTKDMIIRGGFNVYPREIEEALLEHPGVSLAAVLGTPSEEHGEEIVAFVVPVADAEVSADEIVAWSKERLAAYKYPRRVELREELPMTATGKILKRELRKELR